MWRKWNPAHNCNGSGWGGAPLVSKKAEKEKAEKEINKINKLRANHYKHYTEKDWKNPENYDICINSDTLGIEKTADLICEMVQEKENILA